MKGLVSTNELCREMGDDNVTMNCMEHDLQSNPAYERADSLPV